MKLCGVLLVLVATATANRQPHIVVILVDDMGWNDAGIHGSNQIPTPNIDALASSGVLLNRHYTLPSCTPSRSAFLTGKYPIELGMQGFPINAGEPRGLPLGVPLLPERLKQLGYVTRLIGKWHVGCKQTRYTPTRRGFDSHFGYWNGFIGYYDHNIEVELGNSSQYLRGHDFWRDLNADWQDDGKYATDLFTEEAQRIITSHNSSRPLYLQVAHLAVHSGNTSTPLEVPSPEEAHRKFSYIKDPERQLYAEMVSKMDDSVGAIVDALKRSAMLDNSIIVFMSDNGAQTVGMYYNRGSNWPLRGLKLTPFEGGVRGLAAVWSPLISARRRVYQNLMHISDWMPTLYSAAGGNTEDLGALDGVNQWPSLKNIKRHQPRKEVLVNIDERIHTAALISGRWKLVEGSYDDGVYDGYHGDSGRELSDPQYDASAVVETARQRGLDATLQERHVQQVRAAGTISCQGQTDTLGSPPCPDYCLFDLAADPCETRNLATANPRVLSTLMRRMQHFRDEMVPQLNKQVDPNSNPERFNGTWSPWLDNNTLQNL